MKRPIIRMYSRSSEFGSFSSKLYEYFYNRGFFYFEGNENLRFIRIPEDTEVMAGGTVTLTCGATGSPSPSIIWTRVGVRRIEI